MADFLKNDASNDDENWLPIADMMAGLFVIFLLIAIASIQYISKVASWSDEKAASVISLQEQIQRVKDGIYNALMEEFRYDLPVWQAEIDPDTLVFRFNEPEILFDAGSHGIKPKFEEILSSFFPRYLKVLEDYFLRIDEVRIEGHASSEWGSTKNKKTAFLKNMELSQRRVRSVLVYCLNLSMREVFSEWTRKNVTVSGFSSTRPRLDANGLEDKKASRRVEFRVYLNEENIIRDIDERLDYAGP